VNAERRVAIGVMARAPVAGTCKTRLAPLLGDEGAAALYACMLRDTLDGLLSVPAARYVALAAPAGDDTRAARRDGAIALAAHVFAPWEIVAQRGPDLGARLRAGFDDLAFGHDTVVITSTDSPSFPTEPIVDALSALDDGEVLAGPCEDGGYYLIGARRPSPEVLDALFSDIPWSTSAVMSRTRERLAAVGARVREVPTWYDVDEPADYTRLLEELRAHPERAPRTAASVMTEHL
jgi:uncharacterized protein